MIIRFEEIILRPIEDEDSEYLYKYKNNWEVVQHLGGFSKGYSKKEIFEWINFHRAKQDEMLWTIAEDKTNKCIGHCGFYNIEHRLRQAEYAIMIGEPAYWNQGIGKMITKVLIEFGIRQLNLHRIFLTVNCKNEKAINLYTDVGFKIEGRMRDAQFRDGVYSDVIMMGLIENE